MLRTPYYDQQASSYPSLQSLKVKIQVTKLKQAVATNHIKSTYLFIYSFFIADKNDR